MDRTLVLTVGLPRSGKSSWASASGYPVVSPDAVRQAIHGQSHFQDAEELVWATARIMVRSLFLAGHPIVILDACSTTRKRRAAWLDRRWQTCYKTFPITREECIERAQRRSRSDALVEAIHRMADSFELLGDDEPQFDQ